MTPEFELDRFIEAQAHVLDDVLLELSEGRKRTHWMWFVFPQLAGLGHSSTARWFAIRSIQEAEAYLHHPILGARLIKCTDLVNTIEGRSAHDIFGAPDDIKFCSSMTLFSQVPRAEKSFAAALIKYFGGEADSKTLNLLSAASSNR